MKAKCIWFTGYPCSGKTTLAKSLLRYFPNVKLLDGDEIRNTVLANDLGFNKKDRKSHILKIGYIAKLLVDSGITTICSFVSPDRDVRDEVRKMFNEGQFFEIHLTTSKEICEKRDVKGMYKLARKNKIKNFIGVHVKHESPLNSELMLNTSFLTIEQCKNIILDNINPYSKPKALFVGRWNGVFHKGHEYIIQQKLNEGVGIILAIKNVKPDKNNPWTASEVKEMLEYKYKNQDVEVIIIPDNESINFGRNVGYKINEILVPDEIKSISGTECRKLIYERNDLWKKYVPDEIIEFLEKK